ncbi:hypothetical protein IJE86_08050 [bacterium]|nr:hypothetical protein [bacterium]
MTINESKYYTIIKDHDDKKSWVGLRIYLGNAVEKAFNKLTKEQQEDCKIYEIVGIKEI